MIDVRVEFSDEQFGRMARLLDDARIQMAARRASRKTAGWVRTQMARAMGNALQLPKRILAARGKFYDKGWRSGGGSGMAFKVWFGLNHVFADRVGEPRKLARGYAVKGRKFETAFIPKRGRYAGKLYHRTTDARLPIMRARIEIEDEGRKVFEALKPKILGRFTELLKQELNYEILKMEGRAR